MIPNRIHLDRMALVLSSNAVGFLSSLGSLWILGRFLSVSDFGSYGLMLSVQAFGLIFVNAVSPGLLVHLNRDPASSKHAEKTGLRLRLGIGISVSMVCALGSTWISLFLHGHSRFWPAYLLVGLNCLFQGVENHLLQVQQSRNRFGAYAFVFITTRVLKLAGLGILVGIDRLGLVPIFLVLFFGQTLTLLPFWRDLREGLAADGWNPVLARHLTKTTGWTLTTGFVVYLSARCNLFMVNHFFNPHEVGYYNFTETLVGSLLLVSQAVMTVAGPQIMGPNVEAKFRRICMGSLLLGAGYVVTVTPGLWLAQTLVRSLFEGKFDASRELLLIMGFGTTCAMAAAAPIALLHRLGRTQWILALECMSLLTLIGGDFVLMGRLGLAGAAWAFALSRCAFLLSAVVALTAFRPTRKSPT